MHYTSTLETLECIWKSSFMCSAHRVGALAILASCSLLVNCQAFHIDGLHKYSGDP